MAQCCNPLADYILFITMALNYLNTSVSIMRHNKESFYNKTTHTHTYRENVLFWTTFPEANVIGAPPGKTSHHDAVASVLLCGCQGVFLLSCTFTSLWSDFFHLLYCLPCDSCKSVHLKLEHLMYYYCAILSTIASSAFNNSNVSIE